MASANSNEDKKRVEASQQPSVLRASHLHRLQHQNCRWINTARCLLPSSLLPLQLPYWLQHPQQPNVKVKPIYRPNGNIAYSFPVTNPEGGRGQTVRFALLTESYCVMNPVSAFGCMILVLLSYMKEFVFICVTFVRPIDSSESTLDYNIRNNCHRTVVQDWKILLTLPRRKADMYR